MANFGPTSSLSCMHTAEGESSPEFIHLTSNHDPLWGSQAMRLVAHLPLFGS